MKGLHDIFIIEHGGNYRVRPAAWSVDPKKNANNPNPKPVDLLFRNLTPNTVFVLLPDIVDTTAPNATPKEFVLKPRGSVAGNKALDCATLQIKADAPAGVYPYSVVVYLTTGTTTAVGESEPVVIIDPPPI